MFIHYHCEKDGIWSNTCSKLRKIWLTCWHSSDWEDEFRKWNSWWWAGQNPKLGFPKHNFVFCSLGFIPTIVLSITMMMMLPVHDNWEIAEGHLLLLLLRPHRQFHYQHCLDQMIILVVFISIVWTRVSSHSLCLKWNNYPPTTHKGR